MNSSKRGATGQTSIELSFDDMYQKCCSQWPRGLRRGSAADRLLVLWIRIPSGTWKSVCCECCVLSGRGLCDELITRQEESYPVWLVQRPLLDNTQHSQQADIHSPGGIRTHIPSKRAAAVPRLRPRGHRVRQSNSLRSLNFQTVCRIFSVHLFDCQCMLQQTVNNFVVTLCFSRNPGTGADPVPETQCYKVLFILMLETVEKSIKLVFGFEVRNVTKNHIFG